MDELARMGSDIKVEGNTAIITGVDRYTGAEIAAPDLRAGAALVIGALAAEGESVVTDVRYIQRGYEDFHLKLAKLGGQIELVDVPDENIITRMSGRRACVGCGATYHIVYNPTKVEGICDACGQNLILREDDKPETVKKRLEVYHEQTQPLIEHYEAKGALLTVDGTQDINDVFAAITKVLG